MNDLKVLILFVLIFALAGCPAPCDVETNEAAQIRADAAPIIRALENYRTAKNDYPTLLKELAPQYLENMPEQLGGRKFFYRRESNDKYFIKLAARNGGFYSGGCTLAEIGER